MWSASRIKIAVYSQAHHIFIRGGTTQLILTRIEQDFSGSIYVGLVILSYSLRLAEPKQALLLKNGKYIVYISMYERYINFRAFLKNIARPSQK